MSDKPKFKSPEMPNIGRATVFALMLLGGLIAFEMVNFWTTKIAFADIIGNLGFNIPLIGYITMPMIFAFAFCIIDFAGIARIFTPETGKSEPEFIWYLFGAWFLAAAFNSTLTWWAVSALIQSNPVHSPLLASSQAMTKFIPIFIAAGVLAIRVLLINTFSNYGDKALAISRKPKAATASTYSRPASAPAKTAPALSYADRARTNYYNNRPAPKPTPPAASRPLYNEPTYHPVGLSAQERGDNERPSYNH